MEKPKIRLTLNISTFKELTETRRVLYKVGEQYIELVLHDEIAGVELVLMPYKEPKVQSLKDMN